MFVHVFPTGPWKGRAACFSCHFPVGKDACLRFIPQDASHGKTSTFSAVLGIPELNRPHLPRVHMTHKIPKFLLETNPHDPQQRFWKYRLFKDHSKQYYFHRDSNKAWQFFVTFLGWLSDPFKGESWPPTRESKDHDLNHLGVIIA